MNEGRRILAAFLFYTRFPLNGLVGSAPLDFSGIAKWVPLVGVGLGGLWWVGDALLRLWAPDPVRAVLLTGWGILLTGGLHLDGVIDTADGLAVQAHGHQITEERLRVMADSRVGAYGVMAGVMVMALKWVAFASLRPDQGWILILTPAWGRWAQLLAIGCYPYLKPSGQGKILKDTIRWPKDSIPMSMVLGGVTLALTLHSPWIGSWSGLALAIAIGTGFWIRRQLGGHTGDTYGAVVEWTEALTLIAATGF